MIKRLTRLFRRIVDTLTLYTHSEKIETLRMLREQVEFLRELNEKSDKALQTAKENTLLAERIRDEVKKQFNHQKLPYDHSTERNWVN